MIKTRIKALALAAVMVVSAVAFFGSVPKEKAADIVYGSEYEQAVALMKSSAVSGVSVQSFSADTQSITPGYSYDPSQLEGVEIPDSALSDITTLQYYYETDTYAYGITADGSEVIALRKANGQKYDMLAGAGMVYSDSTKVNNQTTRLLTAGQVESFTEGTDQNGNRTLTVSYAVSGAVVAEYMADTFLTAPSVTTVYTLYDNSFSTLLII